MPPDRPLAARTVIVTRAAEQAEALAAPLRSLGAEVVLIPALEIQPAADDTALRRAVANLGSYDFAVVTSTNGADALGREAQRQDRNLRNLTVYAVGPGTVERLRTFGAPALSFPHAKTALELGREIAARGQDRRVLLVQGTNATNELAELLASAGADVQRVDAYTTRAAIGLHQQISLFFDSPKTADAVTFTSPQTALNFFRAIEAHGAALAETTVVASIGAVTSAALRKLCHPPHVEAHVPKMEAMARALGDYFSRQP